MNQDDHVNTIKEKKDVNRGALCSTDNSYKIIEINAHKIRFHSSCNDAQGFGKIQ